MNQFFKNVFYQFLSNVNIHPTKESDLNKLRSLIRSLRPLTTDKSLIRFGPDKDGGYLIPNDLENIFACFSPGVNTVSGFEKECAKLGMEVFLADKSIDKLPEYHEKFNFIKKYIGAMSNDDFITMDDWVNSVCPDNTKELILQMDIEGYEYESIFSMSNELIRRFRIIVVEFHWFNQLFNNTFFAIVSRSFEKILQTHSVVHIHPNNISTITSKNGIAIPSYLEFTFLRNDRIITKDFTDSFPHHLDYDNLTNPTLTLPKCWYKN